jgi:predicted transcriptional regulator
MRRILAKGLDPSKTAISHIMSRELKLASANDEVVEWLRIMSNERFRHLPVVDENGVLVNLMSQGDFVSYTWPQLLGTVKDKAKNSFMESFHLYTILGAMMAYSLAMVLVFKFIK